MTPLVSVIIPVYNHRAYIGECIKSIISQTYTNLEIIVIDDASTDGSTGVVRKFNDGRVIIIENGSNVGLAASINHGIKICNGAFIARMDSDDIAFAKRFELQVKYMLANPAVFVLGTAMQSFGYSNYLHRFPLSHAGCKAQLLFNVCFGHPTVIFRREVFDDMENYYNEELQQYSEEYDLWCRLVDKFNFANLPDVLLYYRTFDEATKNIADEKRRENSFTIRKHFITTQLGKFDDSYFQVHANICNLNRTESYRQLKDWLSWLEIINESNNREGPFSNRDLQKVLKARKFEMHYWNSHLGMGVWIRAMIDNPEFWRRPIKAQIKYLVRSLLAL